MPQKTFLERMFIRGRALPVWRGGLIVLLVFLAYLPALRGGFIWDDDLYVTNNPLLTAPDGLRRIWFSMDSLSQYFPLTYTVFRIEHSLWGLNPAGYHCVNILLHAINALLVWLLLKRLGVPGAWLAAALFALHPVQVESVAWITELKSVLSLFFILLTLGCWIEFVGEGSRRFWYGLALVFYALALFSKTTACTLPAALLLILWLKTKPIDWRRLAQVVPFLAMGLGMGLLAMWWERFHQGTHGKLFSMGLLERILVASHALWFYAGKLFWPVNLTFSYPRWAIDPANPSAYGWLVMGIGLCAAICFTRRFVGRSVEVAALFYVATLSPLLGFVMLYTFRYTFVADHYQYVASIGLIALAAVGITIAFKTKPFLKLACCGALLLTLGILTWQQAGIYRNPETLWRDTLAKNPDCWMAHNNLGLLLKNQGHIKEAMEHYHKALQINPNYAEALNNLGVALAAQERFDEAIEDFRKALQIDPNSAKAQNNLGHALAAKGRFDEAIENYYKAIQLESNRSETYFQLGVVLGQSGRIQEAMVQYREALRLNPDLAGALNNLAWIQAASSNDGLRNGAEAVRLAERACELTHHEKPLFIGTLAAAYAEAGRFPEAVTTAEKAEEIATKVGLTAVATKNRQLLKLYRAGKPYHEPATTGQ
ncbi:MAG: tetratricopeptide repeat protein [Verrucomicrobiota bacterium]